MLVLLLDELNNVLVILGGVNILINLFLARRRLTRELRVVLVGALSWTRTRCR